MLVRFPPTSTPATLGSVPVLARDSAKYANVFEHRSARLDQ